ncbi:MAG: hypothetical protein D6737_10200 [Chloroflexi bacterium]|nr:MAG: hypothetical protein D6737_10200 [Chloroflexota bacterium]
MSIIVKWDNNQRTVIRYIFEGTWQWQDFYQSIADGHVLMNEVDYRVHAIIDIQNSHTFPKDLLLHLKPINTKLHPNTGMTVLVGANSFVHALHFILWRIRPRLEERFMILDSLEEARAFLATYELEI